MDWCEFRNQAAQDLLSCKLLRKENDFGNAAYLLQQSLEKYVKAYLFKHQVFADNPKNLGHIPLKTLFKKIADETDKKIRHSNNPQTKTMFNYFAPIIKKTLELFDNIKDSQKPIWRLAIWKNSLELSLNADEKLILEQLKTDFDNLLPNLMSGMAIFSTDLDKLKKLTQDPIKKQDIEKKAKNRLGISTDNAIEILNTINDDLKNLPAGMPTTLAFFENLMKVSTNSNPIQIEFMKLIRAAWIFTFRNEIIEMFTHEDIGRYPTDIDGISSRTIYSQRVNELDRLIAKVEQQCKKIDEML